MKRAGESQITLLSVFSTFEVGGQQVRFAAIVNHFGRRIRHLIFAMDGCYDCMSRLDPALDARRLHIPHRKGATFANAGLFRKELKTLRPDLLVTHNWGTIEWGMANWPKVVRHVHIEDGFGPEEADRQIARRAWTRRIVLGNARIVVPSRRLERIALDIWKLAPANVCYVPNGIDFGRFSNASIIPLFARGEDPVIGTVAALRPEKNLHRLLDAFRLVRNVRPCKLIVAGEGGERSKLEQHARDLGLAADVVFTGYRTDTERVYASLDIFALSSDTEQMPTSVLEAMAAGLPLASTDVGDVKSLLATENAPFVVDRNENALADALLRLIGDCDLRAKIGEANRNVAAKNYTDSTMFARYGEIFGVPS